MWICECDFTNLVEGRAGLRWTLNHHGGENERQQQEQGGLRLPAFHRNSLSITIQQGREAAKCF